MTEFLTDLVSRILDCDSDSLSYSPALLEPCGWPWPGPLLARTYSTLNITVAPVTLSLGWPVPLFQRSCPTRAQQLPLLQSLTSSSLSYFSCHKLCIRQSLDLFIFFPFHPFGSSVGGDLQPCRPRHTTYPSISPL